VVALRRKGDLGAKLSALAALAVAPNHLEVDQARRALAERELCPRQRQAGATVAGLGIGEVDEVVLRVVGRQEDAQHPALSLSQHGRHIGDRRLFTGLGDQPDGTDLLGDQHPPVRQEPQPPRQVEGRHLGHDERHSGLGPLRAEVGPGGGARRC
jgi:hypothetical protein